MSSFSSFSSSWSCYFENASIFCHSCQPFCHLLPFLFLLSSCHVERQNVTGTTLKDKSKCKCWKCGELGHYSNECQKEKNTFILWGENKDEDLESILSFDSEMSNVYSENDNSSSENDTELVKR